MAQARAFAVVETGVAEVPRLGPRRQPIARVGGDQLPGERGPGWKPWPGAGPPRPGWGDPRVVGPDPVVIVPGVRILLFSILLRSRLLRRAPALDPPARRCSIPPCAGAWGRGPAGAVPNRVHGRLDGSGDRWDFPGTVADGCTRGPPGSVVTAGRSPGGNGPGQRLSCRRASSWYQLWRSRREPPPPASQ